MKFNDRQLRQLCPAVEPDHQSSLTIFRHDDAMNDAAWMQELPHSVAKTYRPTVKKVKENVNDTKLRIHVKLGFRTSVLHSLY